MTLVLSRNEWLECSVLVARVRQVSCRRSLSLVLRVSGVATPHATPVGPRPPFPVHFRMVPREVVVHYTHPHTRLPFVSCLGSNATAIRHSHEVKWF